jgi:tRNA 2-thiouridine synthesizing protein A
MNADLLVDAKGKSCPMPVVLARKGIDRLEAGQVLAIEATDPGSCRDIPAWARDMGHELLETEQAGNAWTYRIRKG